MEWEPDVEAAEATAKDSRRVVTRLSRNEAYTYIGDPTAVAASTAETRRQQRLARVMSTVALALTVLSAGVAGVAWTHTWEPGAARPPRSEAVVDLAAAAPGAARPAAHGWYRTFLRTMVRDKSEMDSKPVTVLPAGILVWVDEADGRRVRLTKPVEGWASLRTEDGVDILEPDLSYRDDLASLFNGTNISHVLAPTTGKVREARLKLEAVRANLTAVEKSVLDGLSAVDGERFARRWQEGSHKLKHAVSEKAPVIGNAAEHALEKVVKKDGVQKIMHRLGAERDVKNLIHDAKAVAAEPSLDPEKVRPDRIESTLRGMVKADNARSSLQKTKTALRTAHTVVAAASSAHKVVTPAVKAASDELRKH